MEKYKAGKCIVGAQNLEPLQYIFQHFRFKFPFYYFSTMIKHVLTLFLFCLLQIAFSQNKKFPPVHEIEKDSSLMKFVTQLKTAATNKDVKFLTAQLDKEVTSSFDGENTVKSFIENWGLNEDSTKFWSYLSRALETGGAYVNDPEDQSGRYQVVFPYVYNFEMDIEDDPYALGCIVGKNVNLREKPDPTSAVKTQLTYDVISFLYEGETQSGTNAIGDPEWYKVETYDQKFRGWVNWKYVYSMTGPRLFLFKDQAGKWRISSFVYGD